MRPPGRILAQHLVRHDGVQNRLLLPGVKVKSTARCHHVFVKPPQQQLGGSGRYPFQNVRSARFQAQAELVGFGGQTEGEGELRCVVGSGFRHFYPCAYHEVNKLFMIVR